MKQLLKADLYRMRKSRLSRIALILACAFPVLVVLLYAGLQALGDLGSDLAETGLFNANSIIGSVYSLTNNIGLVVPAFAGILACSDYSNGTLRNKVIAGNRRSSIYLSHLVVSILFSVGIITIYALVSTGLSLLFFPFSKGAEQTFVRDIVFFVVYGTATFAFVATLSTMLAMVLRSTAPTILFTILFTVLLSVLTTVLSLIDYSSFRHVIYCIPTFAGNFLSIGSLNVLDLLVQTNAASKELIFAEGMLSYLFFGTLHTVVGLLIFQKRDIK